MQEYKGSSSNKFTHGGTKNSAISAENKTPLDESINVRSKKKM